MKERMNDDPLEIFYIPRSRTLSTCFNDVSSHSTLPINPQSLQRPNANFQVCGFLYLGDSELKGLMRSWMPPQDFCEAQKVQCQQNPLKSKQNLELLQTINCQYLIEAMDNENLPCLQLVSSLKEFTESLKLNSVHSSLNLSLIKQYSINGAFSDQMFRDSKMVGPKPLGMK